MDACVSCVVGRETAGRSSAVKLAVQVIAQTDTGVVMICFSSYPYSLFSPERRVARGKLPIFLLNEFSRESETKLSPDREIGGQQKERLRGTGKQTDTHVTGGKTSAGRCVVRIEVFTGVPSLFHSSDRTTAPAGLRALVVLLLSCGSGTHIQSLPVLPFGKGREKRTRPFTRM